MGNIVTRWATVSASISHFSMYLNIETVLKVVSEFFRGPSDGDNNINTNSI